MKKKRRVISKILCFMLMFLMAVQAAPQTVAGVGAALLGSDSGSQADAQNSVLPDADKGQWDVPLATENPNNVDMTIRNGLVYTDYVYEKITAWGYVGGYQRLFNGATQRWEDLTASAGPMINGSYDYDDVNGSWIDHPYITTAVKKSNGDYGIDKNILTPELIIGGSYLNIVELTANDANMTNVFKAAKPYFEHATMKIVADSCNSGMLVCSYLMENKAAFIASGGRLNANIPMTKYGGEGRYPSLTFTTQDSSAGKMENINIAFIDNTSPSIQKVDIGQNGNSLVVTLTTNENIRWAADAVRNDLNDIWLEVDLQVVGTDHTETVRVHVSRINCPKDYNGSSTIEFRGDLGVLADLDYKILDISNASIPKNDYPITFGAILMYALQKKDYNARNITLGKWDNENKKTVYETYNTTAICDTAGNPLNLETVVNWPINQKEIKNDSTFVRKIEFMSDKTLRGSDTKNAEGFMDDITRSDYFFGPNDEISPRLSLNQVLTDEEVASFRIKTNVKDKNGEYIWLSPKSTGKYQINNEEFMYIDFESFVLEQSMSADAQDGNQSYFEITEISCDIKTSPALVKVIPAPEKTLYIDLACPTVTVKSNSLEEPAEQDGYFKLDIEVSIEDTKIDGMLQSGVLEQSAYFYLSGGVNEKTRIYSVIDTESKQPASTSDYKTYVDLTPGDNKLQLGSMGLTSDSANRFFIHLLIPKKTNLFIKDFMVYVDVSDRVGNKTDAGKGYNIAFHIDREMPELNVTSISTVYTADSAITTVKVDATDFNNVRSLRYQWVESGNAYSDGAWEDAIIDEGQKVSATIKKEFDGTAGSVTYDMTLYIKCEDDRGNESLITQKEIKINIDKPSTVYEVTGDLSSPSTHPEITVKGPAESKEGNAGYTRVTVSPLNPKADWMYVTVVKSGEELDVFALDGEWYKVKTSGAMYTQIDMVDGETVTIDEFKNYYGNVKISFENAYQDLTPKLGYMNEYITDGSYIADQNFLTARFASQDVNLTAVNVIDFGKVTDINGQIFSSNGDAGEKSLPFASSERGVNAMRGVTFYFNISNLKMSDWGLLDIDFENSKIELLFSDQTRTDEVIYEQIGLAHSGEQYFAIPTYKPDDGWFETGVYSLRVTVKSRSGSTDVARSMNLVYDAGIPENDGLRSYSHGLKYGYKSEYSAVTPIDSFGIAVQPGIEAHRNNVFAVYTGGVDSFSFTIAADDASVVYDGITVGEVEGFRYWNSLSAPTAEDLEGYEFSISTKIGIPSLVVTSGVTSIYNEENIPKGAAGLGNIYLVEGVNVICYQVKMANGYISPVKQFTIIVTQYVPEFNVVVDDYTPSHVAAQRDGQVNAHDITMRIEEAFSLNGSGNVTVEIWSNYAMEVSGEWVERSVDNTRSLTCLKSGLSVGDTAVLTEDSYTTCFPPYSGQGNYCSAVFVAIDEYGAMVVYAPQIGALSRVYDPSNPISDNYAIEYYGELQDDPFKIGADISVITIYNQPIFFGEQLVGFENLESRDGGPYVQVETSIPALGYNLFAIDTNNVTFGAHGTTESGYGVGARWNAEEIDNYNLIDWSTVKINFYYEDGTPIAEDIDMINPEPNAAGYIGCGYGQISYSTDTGTAYETWFSIDIANPEATVDKSAGTKERIIFAFGGKNIYGNEFAVSGGLYRCYISYDGISETMTGHGITLQLPYYASGHGTTIATGVFNGVGQKYEENVIDAFGNTHPISYEYTKNFDDGTDVSFSTHDTTSEPVVIRIKRDDGTKIYVDVIDAEIIEVEGNGSNDVTVTVNESINFSYKYKTADGAEVVKNLTVSNIVTLDPYISVDVNTDTYLIDEDGVAYRYGNVTITLRDDNFTLTDIYTGEEPMYTFTPGGPASYTFSKDEIIAVFGDEAAKSIPKTLTYSIDFELREVIDPLAEVTAAEAPSIKLNAFKEDRGYFNDEELSLIIEPSGAEDYVPDGKGVTFRYSGKRASASEFLGELGWGTAYRFLAQVTYTGSTKTFIKQGLYCDAPDYETGTSDAVDGVTLNGRLLTVEKNAQFTFFVVAKNGNYTSVVFDVTNIGDAPRPSTVKVPIDNKIVRVYVIAPEGAADFAVTPADVALEIKTESEGEYANVPYVEYDKNDDYIINYTFTYGGEKISGWLDTSVYEIRVREMSQVGAVAWSANKTLEATDSAVSATLNFSEVITGVEITDGNVDDSIVEITSSGKQVKINFNDNHEGFTIKASSMYGNVVVTVDGVSNIDREEPEVWEISRELSSDGKSLTVTLATSERTVFREGGYIGEQSKDKDGNEIYVYTRTLTENGSYTYHFTDMAGIETSITVEVDEIVTEALVLYFSADKDLDNAVTDPSTLVVTVGDKVYVTPSREVTISVNGAESKSLNEGEWLEILLSDDVGGSSPYVIATDNYGRVVIRQFSQIIPLDNTAPVVTVSRSMIYVVAGTDRGEVEKLLLANVFAIDEDSNLTYSVEFAEDISVSGTSAVTYTVKDSRGNSATAECKLRVTSAAEPEVYINGKQVYRDGSYYAESGAEFILTVDVDGQPYCAYIKSGIKTVSQMKTNSTDLTDGYVKDAEVDLGALECGYYTVIIQTQSRDYFRIVIYIY